MRTPHWFLKIYGKSNDTPDQVYQLNITTEELQHLFGEPPGNPMYDCYQVADAQTAALERLIGERILLSAYDYFVECESDG
jgi:hypothetical protein